MPQTTRLTNVLAIFVYALAFAQLATAKDNPYKPQVGDIYFQSLYPSPLVDTIEGATHSPYSHCGVLTQLKGTWFIHEAIGPVRITQLKDWIEQGKGKRYDVYRPKQVYQPRIEEFIQATEKYMGRPYDIQYDFDDEKIYCSELLFKAFQTVYQEDLGKVVTLGELDWQPYEKFIRSIDPSLPLQRKMITPKHLAEADQLELVFKSIKPTK